MMVSSVFSRFHTILTSCIAAVCHYQDDVEACKSVHVVGYANPNPTELFRLATLFTTGHLVFLGAQPLVVTQRNLWNSLKLL